MRLRFACLFLPNVRQYLPGATGEPQAVRAAIKRLSRRDRPRVPQWLALYYDDEQAGAGVGSGGCKPDSCIPGFA